MSERMTPIAFDRLISRAVGEYEKQGTMFGVHSPYIKKDDKRLSIFGDLCQSARNPLMKKR